MNLDTYYPALDQNLKAHLLSACQQKRIAYRKAWNEHKQAFFRQKVEHYADRNIEETSNYLFLFDFCLIWVSNYAQLLTISYFASADQKHDVQHNVMNLIAWRICSDMAAARCLVLHGFDVQAKQVVRSASESIDALGVAALDKNFAFDFVKHQDIEENKSVWFKYISKGKARRAIRAGLSDRVTFDVSGNDKFRDQEEMVLSAAAHPSFVSGLVSLFPDYSEDGQSDNIGISGTISPFSVRTLSYCCFRIVEHCIYDMLLYQSYERFLHDTSDKWNPRLSKEIKNIVDKGREVSILIYGYILNRGELYKTRENNKAADPEVTQ